MIKIFENLTKGTYHITIRAEALSDTLCSVYSHHRHILLFDYPLKSGEIIEKTFAAALYDADFEKQENYRDDKIVFDLSGDCKFDILLKKVEIPAIFTLGDSTVCNQEFKGDSPTNRCGGWGQALQGYVGDGYAVSNHAEQGTHTQNCLSLHLLKVLSQGREGDMVICQFGHNDQKQSWLDAMGGYYENLIKIGRSVLDKHMQFVICSPIQRLIYIDGKLNNYLDPWRDAAKKAAEDLGVKYIDLHSFTSRKYLELGMDAEKLFFHSPELDRTHPNDFGAIMIAEYVYQQLFNNKEV